jgi:hypothetical protein
MAISNFDIATDLKVELFLPNEGDNLFILGVSELGGTDVLAESGDFILGYSLLGGSDTLGDGSGDYQFSWQSVECSVSKLDITLGGSQVAGIEYTAQPSALSFEIQSWTLDPNNNSAVRNGTGIRVRLDDGVTDETLFTGFIESMTVKYRPDAPNLIQGSAFDAYKRLANQRITYNTTGGTDTVTELLGLIAANSGYSVNPANDPGAILMAGRSESEVTQGQLIKDILDAQLGLLWLDPATGQIEYRDRPQILAAATYSIGNNHGDADHWCMSDLTVNQNPDDLVNSVKVTMTTDSGTSITRENLDSIQLYGRLAYDATVNAADSSNLQTWLDLAFTERPRNLVQDVTTPTIDRTNTLTDAALATPGLIVRVDYQTDTINIVQTYQVTRVKHSIDVDRWFTTLELWRAS